MAGYDEELLSAYRAVSTATITTVLLKRGLRNVWIRGAARLSGPDARIAGPAFTMRFIPAREDLATPAAWASPTSSRAAVEAMPEGAIAVVDAGGRQDAGIFGDILVGRMALRGVGGLVTDGVVRDLVGIREAGFPVWASGTTAPPSIAGLEFAGWDSPIGCGGVAIIPGDLIVADGDGAVVVPQALAAGIIADCTAQEHFEGWVVEQVKQGVPLPGLYPPDAETAARYRREAGLDD